MRLYYVEAPNGVSQYAGSNADAVHIRMDFMKRFDARRADIKFDQVEVPTSKAELLAWLNTNVAKAGI